MPEHTTVDELSTVWPPRLTRGQVVAFLNAKGFPIGRSSLDKLCSPAWNKGPPVACQWGKRPLYDPQECLAWAESLLTASQSRRDRRPRKRLGAA